MHAILHNFTLLACLGTVAGCDPGNDPGARSPSPKAVSQDVITGPAGTTKHTRDLVDEKRFLEERLDRTCGELEERLLRSSGEQEVSVLYQIAAMGTARAMAIVSARYDDLDSKWQNTLVNVAAGTGHPTTAPLLLRIARSGNVGQRAHAAERLYVALGKDARDHLITLRGLEKHPHVLFVIRQELLKLKDAALITDLRQQLTSLNRNQLEDLQGAGDLLSLTTEVHCTEVAEEVGDLLKNIDWSQSDGHRRLKQEAAAAALWLGHRASVGHIIDLLENPGSERFDDADVQSLERLLQTYTKQEFRTPANWKAWWEREGKATALFTQFLRPDAEAAIMNAVLAWGRTQRSGPFIEEETAYLMAPHRSCWDREAVWGKLAGNVRVYSPVEIGALGVRPYSLQDISSNGTKAYATLGDGRFDSKWRLAHLELEMANGKWKVVRLTVSAL